jgi:hypothetical protein
MKRLFPVLAVLALLTGLPAFAETTIGPAINTLPYTINKAGVYHLAKNLGYDGIDGAAITVKVPQVVIDMNGYQIECASGTSNTAIGITCTDIARVTVKNGTITGFRSGISLDSNGATVTGMLLTTNYASGITVNGNDAQITGNRVFNTGGAPDATDRATGISLTGTDCTVTNNDVQNTYVPDLTGHYATGIRLSDCVNLCLTNNRVLDTQPANPVNAIATGIATVSSLNLIYLGNVVISAEIGFDLTGGGSGEYGENTTTNDTVTYDTGGSGMTAIPNSNN